VTTLSSAIDRNGAEYSANRAAMEAQLAAVAAQLAVVNQGGGE